MCKTDDVFIYLSMLAVVVFYLYILLAGLLEAGYF